MRSFKYSFLLLFLFIIPFYVSAEEQEHLTYSGSSYSVPFEYYSSDVNVPIEYASYKSGSNTNYVLRTVDGSYGFFTAYYDNSHNVTSYDNEIYLLPSGSSHSLTSNVNSDHNLLKVVFTPARQLQEGEYFTSDEFVGYSLLSFSSYSSSYIQNVISENFGTITDGFTFSANILYFYNPSSTSDVTFMSYYSSSTRTSKFLTFNPSTGAFCNAADTSNCIYPNIQSGKPFNIRVEYVKSTYDFIVNINDEVLTFNRKLNLSSYPFFEFPDNSLSNNPYYYPNSLLLNSVTISEGSKYIKFYPTVINLGSARYKCCIGWTSNTNNFYDYYLNTSYGIYTYTGQKLYGSDVSPLFYIDKTIINSGGSGSHTGEYDFVKKIYPTENNNFIRNYAQYIYAMYSARNKDHLGLYLTRYHKDSDALNSYHLLFDPALNKTSSLSSDVSSDGIVSITMSNDLTLTNSITSIYDTTRYGGDSWTPANGGADFDLYQDSKNWWTYSTLYLDLSDTSIFDIIFKTNPINNKHYTLTDLGINNTIIFETITTSEPNVYDGKPIKFYISFVDYGDYVDYYVLLSLRNGEENSISTIYNCTPFKDLTKMTYYNSIEYLNMSIVYNQFQDPGTADIVQPGEDFNLSDTTIGNYEDMFHDSLIDESAAKQLNAIELFGSSVNDLIDSLSSLNNTLSDLLANLEMRTVQYDIYLNSFNDKDFVKASEFMKTELQWIYDNTPFKVPINIGLSTSIVMAVIF